MNYQLGLMTDNERANKIMRIAWKLYDQHETILQEREQSHDKIERRVLSGDAAAMYLRANNAAREAARFFARC